MRFHVRLAVRASGAAGLGADAQSLVNDGLDGPRAPAAFGAATEAAIDLLGATRKLFRGSTDGAADIVVGKDVAGTDNHKRRGPSVMQGHRYLSLWRDAKGKTVFSSDSKVRLLRLE
jgi:hypothetical protein